MTMTEAELKSELFKLSVEAIYRLTEGSQDPITIQEALERNSNTGTVLYCVEILKVISHSNSKKNVTFILSKNFINDNLKLTRDYQLDKLLWTLNLPEYDIGEVETLMKDDSGSIEMYSEEGVVEWLSRSYIEFDRVEKSTYDLTIKEFQTAVIRAESD